MEAFSADEPVPRFPMRDRDAAYGGEFNRAIRLLEIEDVISAPRSPRQNCFAERVIGSSRRECTDHVIAYGERHLPKVPREYVGYCEEVRPHLSLDRNSPVPRREVSKGEILATPVLGGLHHRYRRAAA